MKNTLAEAGFCKPAEWEKHEGTWLQWPQDRVYRSYELKLEGMWLAMVDAPHQHENAHVIVADEKQRDHVLHPEEGRCGIAHGSSGR
jgi:agmatine/peptidylarginine deiminase